MRASVLILISIFQFQVSQANQNTTACRVGFFKSLKGFFAGEDLSKSSFSFSAEELAGVNEFLNKPSSLKLNGLSNKLERFQKAVLVRYNSSLNPQTINAFGKLDDFYMLDQGFSAEVKIYKKGETLFVEIPNVKAASAGSLGSMSRGLDVGFAHFFATVTKGIEYRLSMLPEITKVEIMPSKVVNRKLKEMLGDFGFEKTSELPDWGDMGGFRSGMGPAAEYKMVLDVSRNP